MMGAILQGRSFAPEWMGGFGRFVEPIGILAIFNAIGRIFWGKISDIIDRPDLKSDAWQLGQYTGLPVWFWGFLWIAIAIAGAAAALVVASRGEERGEAA